MTDKLETNKTLAIGSGVSSSPEFIEVLDVEAEGWKLKYYMWLSRLFIVFATFSLLLMIASGLALFKLAPMVIVEPFLFINQDATENIVREEPISQDMASKDKLMEMFIRQYIIYRNTIINDPIEMRTRWLPGGIVDYLSSEEVFTPFYEYVVANWKNIFETSLVREVEITSIGKQGGKKSPVWRVDFITYDLYNGEKNGRYVSVLRTRNWTASITPYFIKDRYFYSRRLVNPLGFTVTRYSQTEVEVL